MLEFSLNGTKGDWTERDIFVLVDQSYIINAES